MKPQSDNLSAIYKECRNCNQTFACYPEHDCWCEEFEITKGNMYSILQQYDDCICPKCLSEHNI